MSEQLKRISKLDYSVFYSNIVTGLGKVATSKRSTVMHTQQFSGNQENVWNKTDTEKSEISAIKIYISSSFKTVLL